MGRRSPRARSRVPALGAHPWGKLPAPRRHSRRHVLVTVSWQDRRRCVDDFEPGFSAIRRFALRRSFESPGEVIVVVDSLPVFTGLAFAVSHSGLALIYGSRLLLSGHFLTTRLSALRLTFEPSLPFARRRSFTISLGAAFHILRSEKLCIKALMSVPTTSNLSGISR